MTLSTKDTQLKGHSAEALSVIMLSVAFSYCYPECHYGECRYAECCYAECHGA
jgi:hypothetical protein